MRWSEIFIGACMVIPMGIGGIKVCKWLFDAMLVVFS